MVEIATIFAVIGYASTSIKFFNNVNELSKQQFQDANALIRDIHEMVVYQADKTLLGKIDVKFQRLQTILKNWKTIDKTTKKAFAKEILEGDGSVDNAIWRFHNSVYAPGGYFELKTTNILNEKYGLLGILGTSSRKAGQKLRKFFPTMLEVEMKATTLIYFGYYVKRLYSSEYFNVLREISWS